MGGIRHGPPTELLLLLSRSCEINTFVECGSFKGATAIWAGQNFEQVITIEASEVLYRNLVQQYSDRENISFRFGHSVECLREIVPTLEARTIFWLDSHWCGELTFGEEDECPLMEEIEVLNEGLLQHIILIDDARLFLSPPPPPHNPSHWPSIGEVILGLNNAQHTYFTIVHDDIIIAVPEELKQLVVEYAREADRNLEEESQKPTVRNFLRKGVRFVERRIS